MNPEPAPLKLDDEKAKAPFRKKLLLSLRTQHPQGRSRFAGIVVAALTVLALGWTNLGAALGLGAFLGLATWVGARIVWYLRILALTYRRLPIEWPQEHRRLELEHSAALEAYAARSVPYRERWLAAEQERIAELRRVLDGDLAAIERAVSEALDQLDFPFDADCAFGIDDEDHVLVDIDLPEIEDVVPDTRYTVSEDGTLKEIKRKAADRNQAYATLVTGIAFTVAATAFAAAPSLDAVTVAGHTQRKSRNSLDAVDTYVYEVRIQRATFALLNASTLDPIEAMERLPSRIEMSASGVLKKLAEPKWAEALWAPQNDGKPT